jgi:hypothetical protein
MKQDRVNLEELLHSILANINTEKKQKEDVINIMRERHNFTSGEAKKIINETIQVEYLSVMELCILTVALYEVLKDNRLNPELFFNQSEIFKAQQFKKQIKEKNNRLIFENTFQISDRQWICPIRSFQQLADDLLSHNVVYNFETQRDPIIKEYENTIIRIPNIMPAKVSAIKKEITNNTFTKNMITYNILRTEVANFFYDHDKKVLIVEIDENTEVSILDGANRLWSITELITEQPNFEGNMVLNILNYDIREAQHFIRQEQLAAPISKERTEMFDYNDYNMMIAKDINKQGNIMNNEMYNKIAVDKNELEKENKYVLFSTFRDAIAQNFTFNNAFEVNKVRQHIMNVLNYIIYYFRDKYGDLDVARKQYKILTNNIFYGYIALAGKTFNHPNWEQNINSALNMIDFSNSNTGWKEISVDSLSRPKVKELTNLFVSKIEDGE